MEFTLWYRGELRSNGDAKHKHEIRQHFHRQLTDLWRHPPLNNFAWFLDPENKGYNVYICRDIRSFTFAPLVCTEAALVCELRITLFRPEPPGAMLAQSGDLDNRLKTLLDALKVPSEPNALPTGAVPSAEESPFYCLLEDDCLITHLSVTTDRLLEPVSSRSDALALVHVTTKQTRVFLDTIGLA